MRALLPALAPALGLLVILVAAVVRAGVIVDDDAGLRAEVPDNWVQTFDDGVVTVSPTSGEARVVFVSRPADSLEAARPTLDVVLADHVENAVVTGPWQTIDANGVPGVLTSGTGASGGEAVHWGAALFFHEGHAWYVIAVAEQASYADYQDDLSLIMVSVAPR